MKRRSNWFAKWVSKMGREEKIGFSIGGIMGIIAAISLFASIDKVPATPADYEAMEKQVIAIQKDPKSLFNADCEVCIKNEVITVNFENDECKMTVEYDSNFEVVSISKEDNYMFWMFALVFALFIGFVAYGTGSFLVTVAIFLIEILWEFILKKFEICKYKFQRR